MRTYKGHKGTANFETYTIRGNEWHIATCGNIEISVAQTDEGDYIATLRMYDRPMLSAMSDTAKCALKNLTIEARNTAWTDETFYNSQVFPLARDLNKWMKRDKRETYNDRR